MDSYPIPHIDASEHLVEALRDILNKPSFILNGIQRADIPTSIIDQVHDVHLVVTLNEILNEDTTISSTYIDALLDLSFIPIQAMDRIPFDLSKQQMIGKHPNFQSIIQPVDLLRPHLVQPSSVNYGINETICFNSIQPIFGEIKSDFENQFFMKVLFGHFDFSPTSRDTGTCYSSINSVNQALFDDLLYMPIRELGRNLNIQIDDFSKLLKSDIYIYNPLIRKFSSSDLVCSINTEIYINQLCLRMDLLPFYIHWKF
jgi:hypothetical protein